MARIKLNIPDSFDFRCEIPVRITDVNYGGHVGNDALLGIIHEARLRFLQHHKYSEMDLAGVALIMTDVAIEFKNEAFYGDVLYASVVANDFQRISFDILYKIEKEVDSKKIVVAVAKTGMVCYDYILKKVCNVPETVLQQLQLKP